MRQHHSQRGIFGLAALLALALAASAPATQTQKKILPGLVYQNKAGDQPLSVHILELDPRKVEVAAARALNDGVGKEKVSSMARREGAVAAFNGGFFSNSDRYDGDPAGILKVGGAWYSDQSLARGAIGWTRDGSKTLIGKVAAAWSVRIGGQPLRVNSLNRARGRGEIILYNWPFHRSTLTDPGGVELIVSDNRIAEITRRGNAPIPPDGLVVSFGPMVAGLADRFEIGSECRAAVDVTSHEAAVESGEWEKMDFIVGGSPVLLRDGELHEALLERQRAKLDTQRHPRTAIGVRPDGRWVVLVVDGRQPGLSRGMTLKETALALLDLGCTSALNLDGGGSTTLFLQGSVVNSPSDFGIERAVSDAILIRRRSSEGGEPGS